MRTSKYDPLTGEITELLRVNGRKHKASDLVNSSILAYGAQSLNPLRSRGMAGENPTAAIAVAAHQPG